MLAAIPGELIGVVIFAVAALLKWLGDRATEQEKTKTPPPIPRRGGEQREAASSTRGDAEAERKRRFMEALGIPADDLLGPRQGKPQVLRPESRVQPPAIPREGRTKPIPPIVFREPMDPRTRRPQPTVSLRPVTESSASPQAAPRGISPTPIPPRAATAQARNFSDDIGAQGLAIGDIAEEARDGIPHAALPSLREELKTASAVRRAIVLREILGPPLGLQSVNSLPNFRRP